MTAVKRKTKKFLVGRRICRFDLICGFQCRHDFGFYFLGRRGLFHLAAGRRGFAWAALLKIYALKPVYWFVLQGVLMLVFYLHRVVVCKQSAALFSATQLQMGWLVAVVMQAVVAMALIFERGGY